MKVAVMGAGAVGCYYGAMLAQAGHHVALVGRPHHVAAVQEHGLRLEVGGVSRTLQVDATTDPSGVADADTILFCVKSDDTGSAGHDMLPHLSAQAVVLSLQNGVDNAERLQSIIGRPVVPAAVYVAADMPGPGHVRHSGRGELVIGSSPSSDAIAEMFCQAGIPTEISSNVAGVLWTKLIINCAYNALSAIVKLPYGRLMEVAGTRDIISDIVGECLAVANGLGVATPGDILTNVLELASSMPNQYSSTAQDLSRGKRTEIDHLNGYVVRMAKGLGISTPVNRLLVVQVKLIESKGV